MQIITRHTHDLLHEYIVELSLRKVFRAGAPFERERVCVGTETLRSDSVELQDDLPI